MASYNKDLEKFENICKKTKKVNLVRGKLKEVAFSWKNGWWTDIQLQIVEILYNDQSNKISLCS